MQKSNSKYLTVLGFMLTTLISIHSCSESKEANQIALDANKKAFEANSISSNALKVEEENSYFAKKSLSNSITNTVYDKFAYNEYFIEIDQNLSNLDEVDINKIGKFVDEFEGLGHQFCEGQVFRDDIRANLKEYLYQACTNPKVYNNWKHTKNGLSMLCAEIHPESEMAKSLEYEPVSTCNFLDEDGALTQKFSENINIIPTF